MENVLRVENAVVTIAVAGTAAAIVETVEIVSLAAIARTGRRNRPRATHRRPLHRWNPDPLRPVPLKARLRFSPGATIANPASSGLPVTAANHAAMRPNPRPASTLLQAHPKAESTRRKHSGKAATTATADLVDVAAAAVAGAAVAEGKLPSAAAETTGLKPIAVRAANPRPALQILPTSNAGIPCSMPTANPSAVTATATRMRRRLPPPRLSPCRIRTLQSRPTLTKIPTSFPCPLRIRNPRAWSKASVPLPKSW